MMIVMMLCCRLDPKSVRLSGSGSCYFIVVLSLIFGGVIIVGLPLDHWDADCSDTTLGNLRSIV